MLVLSRRIGESLNIGDDIVITILGVKGNQVRIGIQAPKEIAVHRQEIFNKIQRGLLPADYEEKSPVQNREAPLSRLIGKITRRNYRAESI